MSTGLPKRFDPQRLADQGKPLAGEISTANMSRLHDALADDAPVPVQVALRVFRDEAKRLVLAGEVDADLVCTCQRCMEPVTVNVKGEFSLAVVADEDAADKLPAELDPLLLDNDSDVDLAAVVEDELLLALPVIAMHADTSECGERARLVKRKEASDNAAKRNNPFAVLKKLKQDNPD